jgi:rubrerythrin
MSDDTTHQEGHGAAYQRLKQMQSIEQILDTAMSFEKTAKDFYGKLVDQVSKPLRYLVKELAEEEQRHYDLFKELKNHPALPQFINERIATPPSDHRFSDYIQAPELGDNPDDQSVLQYALGREHTAMEQYEALARETPPGPVKDVFTYLAQEELQHKQELEKYYYQIVHSGGV